MEAGTCEPSGKPFDKKKQAAKGGGRLPSRRARYSLHLFDSPERDAAPPRPGATMIIAEGG